jgi:hypothetical protein
MSAEGEGRVVSDDQAGGPADLSRCAYQPVGAHPSRVEGWQPIETAPRDKVVDLWWNGRRFADYEFVELTGDWVRKELMWKGEYQVTTKRFLTDKPTHWMPLPPAPGAA